MNSSALLSNAECRDPDGDQTVLAIREAVSRVSGDFEEEAPVMASVRKLLLRRAVKRNPTKDKRPRDVGEFLLARVPLVTNELNSLQVFQSALRDTDGWQRRSERRKGWVPGSRGLGVPPFEDPGQSLLQVFQKCSKSLRNRPERGCFVSESRSPEGM